MGHAALPRLDAAAVARLYTGRSVEVAGQPVTLANAPAGMAEVFAFVRSTPGAVACIDASEVRPGLNAVATP
jgi:hypothetical protein